MSESSNREALEGLISAVAAAIDEEPPHWVLAYAHLLGDEVLDRHHVRMLIGLAQRDEDQARNERWIRGLADAQGDDLQRWVLSRVWESAERQPRQGPLPEARDPFMKRIICELECYPFEERGALVEAMDLRRALYESMNDPGHLHGILSAMDLADDLLTLSRTGEARSLLQVLEPMVDALSDPEVCAEFHDRMADLARDSDESAKCQEHYAQALEHLDQLDNPHARLSRESLEVSHLVQRGEFHAARAHLERLPPQDDHPFAARRYQRRLTSLCQLCTTLEDKRALYSVLQALIESVLEVGWALFGSLSSHLDDLVNLACQLGEEQDAEDSLQRIGPLAVDEITSGWLEIAALRLAVWRGQETGLDEHISRALSNPLAGSDLFFCQTAVTFADEHGESAHEEACEGAIARCLESLIHRELSVRASALLHFKAQRLSQSGAVEGARETFEEAVTLLERSGHHPAQVIEAAMEWASWEIGSGHLEHLEEPIELVIRHAADETAPGLMAQLSFQQAMFFAMNPVMGEAEEDPKAVVGRWIALAADQYIEAGRLGDANGVYIQLAEWLDSQGEFEAASEILELVAQGAMTTGDTKLIWHAALVTATRMDHEGDSEGAISLLAETLRTCEAESASGRGAQHFEFANLLHMAGRAEEALAHHERALELLVDGSVRDRTRLLLASATSCWQIGQEERAVALWTEALDHARRSADREFISEIAQRIDSLLVERQDKVASARIALLEDVVSLGERCRWDLIAKGSDLPLRLVEEYARAGTHPEAIDDTVRCLRDLAEAVTGVGHPADGTLLLQRAAGIEMLRGHHDRGLELMRQVLDRVEATSGAIGRAREGLLQAALLTAGGLVHEAWDRVSEVRDWLVTVAEEESDEEALDELTLTCQMQSATLHLLGDMAEEVEGPMLEFIAISANRDEHWAAMQSARVTLAAALVNLGRSEEASTHLMAIEAHLDEGTSGWFDAVIMAGRIGQRALGEAIVSGIVNAFRESGTSRWSNTDIALLCASDWLAFTSGETVEGDAIDELSDRALAAKDFNLATVLRLVAACYADASGDEVGAKTSVAEAVEIARQHWAMDEFGLMWGVLLPPRLKHFAAALLEADRLQHVN